VEQRETGGWMSEDYQEGRKTNKEYQEGRKTNRERQRCLSKLEMVDEA